MKLNNFNNLKGLTPLDKLQSLLELSPDGKIWCQPKLNGIFCRVTWDDKKLTYWTKDNKKWGDEFFPFRLRDELAYYLNDMPPCSLLGEMFAPGRHLTELAGDISVNRAAINPRVVNELNYYPFDIFLCNELSINQHFYERQRILKNIFDELPANPVQMLFQGLARSAAEADAAHTFNLQAKHEGTVYRIAPCLLYNGLLEHAFKRKDRKDDEAVCIGVVEGLGKRQGSLGALLLKLRNNKVVKIGGGAGMDNALLLQLFNNPPLGKMVTYSYEELSPDGIPLRAQFVAVRDYES